MDAIQKIYIALFGRPADPAGLAFFANETNNGADLSAIANLSGQDEYQDRFEGDDSATIITEIYVELFGRNPELAELTYWLGQFEARGVNNIAIAIAQSAQNDDLVILNNKVAAANLFTASINTPEELAAYRGDNAEAAGREFLDTVTADEASIPTQAEVDAAIAEIVDNSNTGGGTVGNILTLTTGDDVVSTSQTDLQFQSTNNDDTIRATTANSLSSNDVISAGNGFDILNISATAIVAGGASPVLTSVERVNNASTVALDLSASTGVQQLWSTGTAGNYTGVASSTVVGAALTAAGTIAVDYAGAATSASLAIDDSVGLATITSADAATVTSVSVAALGGSGTGTTGDAANDEITVAAFNNVETLTVTGTGNVTVTADGSDLDTVNVSATGRVTLSLVNSDEDTTLNFGSGAATFIGTGATGDLTINGGAGADTLVGGGGDDTIVGGAGNDILAGGAGADSLTGGDGNDEFHFSTTSTLDVVTDFTVGQDVISLLKDNGAVTTGLAFDNSTDSGVRGQSDLAAEDFNKLAGFANVTLLQDDEVVVFTNGMTDAQITAGGGAAAEIFYVVYNTDDQEAQLYYTASAAAGGGTLVATLDGLDLADVQALTQANFDVYI